MKELIREIKGFPNYSVTTTGRVINTKTNKEKVLGNDHKGYAKVDLYSHGKRTTRRVHILVADAFLEEDHSRPEINHKDGNKLNNNITNLERVTKSENIKHAYKTGLAKPHPSYGMLGKKNPNGGAKGKPIRIVETNTEYKSTADCERKTGLRSRGINDCLKGRQHTHKGYHFQYV